jgi:hypothetical protein
MKKIKYFMSAVLALMLITNAGIDFGRWTKKHAAEAAALKSMAATFDVEGGGGIKPKINACFPIEGLGWVCDFELNGPNGEHARGSHFFTFKDLANG